jgi:hypothetical protein
MKSLVLASLLVVPACFGGERASTGQCPAGEVCSPATPNGLHFIGQALIDDVLVSGPAATAIGGTQDVALQYDRGDGILIALDLPYTADDDGGIGVKVDHSSGSVVTVRGMKSRTNYLRILDPATDELYDRKELTAAALDTIQLVPTDFETVPAGTDLAWNAGAVKLGVALFGAVQESTGPEEERLVDTSMTLSLGGASRKAWDEIELAATPGTYPLTVTAGDKPAADLDVVVVDHADAITAQDASPTIPPGGSASLCFTASANSRYIVGLSWSFLVDGTSESHGDGSVARNCITVTTTKTQGTVSVQVAAGGMQMALAVPIGAATRIAPKHVLPRPMTAGDRAAM